MGFNACFVKIGPVEELSVEALTVLMKIMVVTNSRRNNSIWKKRKKRKNKRNKFLRN